MMVLASGATLFGIGWLVLILGVLVWQGLDALSLTIFTEMTLPPGTDGGLLNPIIGSMIMTALAVAIGTPIGILAGTCALRRWRPLVPEHGDHPFRGWRPGWHESAAG
jgi:phosphate transport system permease protein